jgi:hypothetical protein
MHRDDRTPRDDWLHGMHRDDRMSRDDWSYGMHWDDRTSWPVAGLAALMTALTLTALALTAFRLAAALAFRAAFGRLVALVLVAASRFLGLIAAAGLARGRVGEGAGGQGQADRRRG